MLLGVLSDSHDNVGILKKAGAFFREKGVAAVLHAGDWVAPFSALALREGFGPEGRLIGVFGNNDGERHYFAQVAERVGLELLPEAGEVELGGRRIALYHGTAAILTEALIGCGKYDLVVTGHTHRAETKRVGKSLWVNPGELCGALTGANTVALVDLDTLQAEIIKL